MARSVSLFHDERISVHASIEGSLLKPHILKLTYELIKAYGLLNHVSLRLTPTQWQPASVAEVTRFHTDAYVHFLEQLESNAAEVRDEAGNYVLNPSVVFTETAWLYSQAYTGGSLAAARMLRSSETDIAICWMGGQTHARRDCASGFSFVNDVVLAILALLQPSVEEPNEERRVLFLNLDAWHCSGVEEAFYTTDRVLCLSLHHRADGVYPGSGGSADCGEERGKHHTINLPVSDGLTDENLDALLLPVLAAAAGRFCPHVIVCCAGAGLIAGDRLGCLNVSLDGHSRVLKALMSLELPLLVLGGCGFTQLNAAKVWCHATATLCGVELPMALPEHSYMDYYLHEPTLSVPTCTLDNRNSALALEALKETALYSVEQMPQRVKPQLKPKRAAAPPADAPPPLARTSTSVIGGASACIGLAATGAPPTDVEMRSARTRCESTADASAAASGMEPAAVPPASADEGGGAPAPVPAGENGAVVGMDVDGGEGDAGRERIDDDMVAEEHRR
eukprot:jgi/Chrpa1/23418/Chrysochromulina_OHIO_Genome00010671-RA